MKVIQFEGTPEEFRAVSHLFQGASNTSEADSTSVGSSDAPTMEPVEAIRRMLTRIPVSEGQRAVYKALADGRIEISEFRERTGRSAETLAGVLGSLGRRINKTKEIHKAGLPGGTGVVMTYEQDGGKSYLSLTPEAEEALKAEGII